MNEFLHRFFSDSEFMPHGHCYLWKPEMLWLHIGSDALIALAYYSIPVTLLRFIWRRRDLPYPWIFVMFGAFIVACGTTHVMEIWSIWHGTYWFSGGVKAITALLSVSTAILLVKLIPQALQLKGPATLARVNAELEARVSERTEALSLANATMHNEITERIEAEKQLALALKDLNDINAALKKEITLREQGEAELRGSEKRSNFALQKCHTGGWDLDLVDHTAHRALEHDRIFGYESLLPQWTYEMFLDHVLPEDRAGVDRLFRAATAAQTEWSFECRIRRRDGEVRWIWAAGEHQRDGKGAARSLAGIVQDITLRKQAEEKISASLREKEVLLKEVHHRVKNNLQVISGLLSFQQQQATEPGVVAQFQQSRNRVAAIALVHERLYQSQNLSEIDFADYVRDLTSSIMQSFGTDAAKVQLTVTGGGFSVDMDQAVPCALILNELVSNAMKHAFPGERRGVIRIELGEDVATGILAVRVSDDGTGLPEGVGHENTHTLGLRLVHRLSNQLQGKIEILNTQEGAAFLLTFPRKL